MKNAETRRLGKFMHTVVCFLKNYFMYKQSAEMDLQNDSNSVQDYTLGGSDESDNAIACKLVNATDNA